MQSTRALDMSTYGGGGALEISHNLAACACKHCPAANDREYITQREKEIRNVHQAKTKSFTLTMVCVFLLLPRAFLALGWLLEFSPHDTILCRGGKDGGEGSSVLLLGRSQGKH